MKHKFKVGDRVRVIASRKQLNDIRSDWVNPEQVGEVVSIGFNDVYGGKVCDIMVAFDDRLYDCCSLPTDYLKLIEPEAKTPHVSSPEFWKLGLGTDSKIDTDFKSTNLMTLERFDILVDYIVEERIKKVMCSKSKEYANDGNKLHNFDHAGQMRGITPMEALRGMKLKHEVSIEDMLNGLQKGKTYPQELWEEKFTDNINYQILQWAILARDNGWLISLDRNKPVEGGY